MNEQNDSQHGFFDRIRYSIIRGAVHPGTDKERKRVVFENLILHLHPRTVPEATLKFTLTWGLGGMSLVLLMLLGFTGILLLFVYEPFPDKAYASILRIQNDIYFGQFIRNIHHWSANILVIIAFLHLLRVFFTGAIHNIRQLNWVIGLLIFLCVLIANFTGYLMPWDQLSFWAITISLSMLDYIPVAGAWFRNVLSGGTELGPTTLMIFFTLHTTVIPVCFVILLPFHFWRIRKSGGLVIPHTPGDTLDGKPVMAPTIPDLVLREIVVALTLIAFILVYSIMFNAPLQIEANPGMSPNPTKAPWYFQGIQELLFHFHPVFAVFIIPFALMLFLFFLPYVNYDSTESGIWFHSFKGRSMGFMAALIAVVATPLYIFVDEHFIDFAGWFPGISPVINNGFIPVMIMAAVMTAFYFLIKKKYSATNNETIQALFILLLVMFMIMMVTSIWFRGEGMALIWP